MPLTSFNWNLITGYSRKNSANSQSEPHLTVHSLFPLASGSLWVLFNKTWVAVLKWESQEHSFFPRGRLSSSQRESKHWSYFEKEGPREVLPAALELTTAPKSLPVASISQDLRSIATVKWILPIQINLEAVSFPTPPDKSWVQRMLWFQTGGILSRELSQTHASDLLNYTAITGVVLLCCWFVCLLKIESHYVVQALLELTIYWIRGDLSVLAPQVQGLQVYITMLAM